ncbi:helicase-exonuclease AddAB subunit AddA [Paenibacillus koleovorans]|uniref:helicase-exonuclease AddAB subunit AddA n=1 Tax=Paenibacillus koleovorans TaxID=121608 RepID=UPI000FDB6D7F|nr:helicase-exonuclease AddAB subunit AddA [Paenibacillus koleovorans]
MTTTANSLDAKPAGSSWTDEQWEAIRTRGGNVLVAAAAGSGKTAVLVERIIRRVTDEQEPIDVDRLLVATFTNAAAGEMRQRIREALEKELQRNPHSTHLKKQISLIHRASITTLHSFCLEIVHRYFARVQLDPSFRIANETETELMRQDLLAELMEEEYGHSEENDAFWQLVDWFGGERGDEALSGFIQQLYDFSRSHPWPENWLSGVVDTFATAEQGEAGSSAGGFGGWLSSLLQDARLELRGVEGLLSEAEQLAESPGGPTAYIANLRADRVVVAELLETASAGVEAWDSLFALFQTAAFGKLNASRSGDVDKQVQEQVKKLREQAKKQLYALQEELFQRTADQYRSELTAMAPIMAKLADIVNEFAERFRAMKAEKGLVDFSDLEHYCLRILRHSDSTPAHTLPSDAADEYRQQFAEVLLDEYQDTNMVQEAIVELMAARGPGNRFMVGDVKQSIYRFRLAEPGLFLNKYEAYRHGGGEEGQRIDLARNFRSRREVVDGVNFLFKQLMSVAVAEMEYDEAARLVCGAAYPDSPNDCSVELLLIDKAAPEPGAYEAGEGEEEGEDPGAGGQADKAGDAEQEEQAETAQLEARLIAATIRRLRGETGEPPFQVYDRGAGGFRAMQYRDVVILLRSPSGWSSTMLEELQQAGVPVYAQLNSGYFAATEVETILSLLQVIDNPYQDIPLAAVLRSPIFALTADELAQARLFRKHGPYYEAVAACAEELSSEGDKDEPGIESGMEEAGQGKPAFAAKLSRFMRQTERWRASAREGSLADLIWTVYRETGYFDYVGGLAGGLQRQANLRALYDRARQYESTSFRGLYRFLRFIERMQENGGDLGTARALGEQEDVVRIMSIHKSKGLEFPVVFVAGLGKKFNLMDLNGSFLMHKQLGLGPKFVDTSLRVSYPTLPMLAIRKRMRMEMLAEEMRVLYVALTRPKEKLYLLGTLANVEKQLLKWSGMLSHREWVLPDYELAKGRCFLDWIGPALVRHPQATPLREWAGMGEPVPEPDSGAGTFSMELEPSKWSFGVFRMDGLLQAAAAVEGRFADDRMEAVSQLEPAPAVHSAFAERVKEALNWRNPHAELSKLFSKTSVTELKRLTDNRKQLEEEEQVLWLQAADPMKSEGEERRVVPSAPPIPYRRPKFVEQRRMNAAERGTVYHAVMQHVELDAGVSLQRVEATMDQMVAKQLLTAEQRAEADANVIHSFYESPLGRRMLASARVVREVPFSYGLKAGDVYPNAEPSAREETILIQGVIDCLFEENGELVLVDYKTDQTNDGRLNGLVERYRFQLNLYARAIEQIWKRPVKEQLLYFFDGAHTIRL